MKNRINKEEAYFDDKKENEDAVPPRFADDADQLPFYPWYAAEVDDDEDAEALQVSWTQAFQVEQSHSF
jgi:hypothetical protein